MNDFTSLISKYLIYKGRSVVGPFPTNGDDPPRDSVKRYQHPRYVGVEFVRSCVLFMVLPLQPSSTRAAQETRGDESSANQCGYG